MRYIRPPLQGLVLSTGSCYCLLLNIWGRRPKAEMFNVHGEIDSTKIASVRPNDMVLFPSFSSILDQSRLRKR